MNDKRHQTFRLNLGCSGQQGWREDEQRGEGTRRSCLGFLAGLCLHRIADDEMAEGKLKSFISIRSRGWSRQSSCCLCALHSFCMERLSCSPELWEVKHKHIWPFCYTRCLERFAHILFSRLTLFPKDIWAASPVYQLHSAQKQIPHLHVEWKSPNTHKQF